MERNATIEEAKLIMGSNFLGVEELESIQDEFPIIISNDIPKIQFSAKELLDRKDEYLLILGMKKMKNGKELSLRYLREFFGIDPLFSEPCFYNQDWYLNEYFFDITVENKWYLIKKDVFEEARGVEPTVLKENYNFPSAILCAYTFFIMWFCSKKILWKYDFVWCSDLDHNGDRIYVGKYFDVDGVNKNGFSIHRHLALRNSYSSVTLFPGNEL